MRTSARARRPCKGRSGSPWVFPTSAPIHRLGHPHRRRARRKPHGQPPRRRRRRDHPLVVCALASRAQQTRSRRLALRPLRRRYLPKPRVRRHSREHRIPISRGQALHSPHGRHKCRRPAPRRTAIRLSGAGRRRPPRKQPAGPRLCQTPMPDGVRPRAHRPFRRGQRAWMLTNRWDARAELAPPRTPCRDCRRVSALRDRRRRAPISVCRKALAPSPS